MANKHRNKNKNKNKNHLRNVPQQSPQQQQPQIRFTPYNPNIHAHALPFEPGQVMVIANIGLRIIQCFPNGDFVLRPEAVPYDTPSLILPNSIAEDRKESPS